jgi:hypothetical protein
VYTEPRTVLHTLSFARSASALGNALEAVYYPGNPTVDE